MLLGLVVAGYHQEFLALEKNECEIERYSHSDPYFFPLFEKHDEVQQSYSYEFNNEEFIYSKEAYQPFVNLEDDVIKQDQPAMSEPQVPDATIDSINTEASEASESRPVETMDQLHEEIYRRLRKQKLTCCGRQFDSGDSLELHVTYSHYKDTDYVCFECNYTHRSAGIIVQHIRKHLDDTIFQCPNCDKNSVNISGLKNHFKSHKAKIPQKQGLQNNLIEGACTLASCANLIALREEGIEKKCCNTVYESKESLHEHLIANHLTGTEFNNADVAIIVEQYLLEKDKTLYACPMIDCGQLHQSSAELLAHYDVCMTKKKIRNNLLMNLKRKGIDTTEYGQKRQRLV